MYPYRVIDDLLYDSTGTGIMFHNEGAEKDITIRLPFPRPCIHFEILQLAGHSITLHTNSEEVSFLRSPRSNLLTISGKPTAYGRSLEIEAYQNCWRITRSTFNERQLTFKEISQCLDTVTTN